MNYTMIRTTFALIVSTVAFVAAVDDQCRAQSKPRIVEAMTIDDKVLCGYQG